MKMKFFFFSAFLMCLATMTKGQAVRVDTLKNHQEQNNNYRDDNRYQQNDFSYEHKKKKHNNSESETVEDKDGPKANAVKIPLLYWLSGNIPLYYERRVASWFGLQVGLGPTTRDFMADLVNVIISKGGEIPYYGYASYKGRKSLVGLHASLAPKFYPSRHALSGFVITPMAEFKWHRYSAQEPDRYPIDGEPNFSTGTWLPEERKSVDFTINFGYHWNLRNNVDLEFMGGGGFRRFWETRQNLVEGEDNFSNTYFYRKAFSYDGWRPEFNVGLTLGGCF